MEESVIVTTEKVEFPLPCNTCSGGDGIKRLDHLFEIRLLGHCIFCLRKVRKEGPKLKRKRRYEGENYGEGDAVEAVLPSGFLETFQRLWQLVQSKLKQISDEENEEHLLPYLIEQGKQITPKIRFSEVPTLCQTCADKLLNLESLMGAIRQQVDEIWEITEESRRGGVRYSERGEKFENELRKGALIGPRIVDSTLEFLYGPCETGAEKLERDPLSLGDETFVNTTTNYTETSENLSLENASINIPIKEEADLGIEDECVKVEIDEGGGNGNDIDSDPDYMEDPLDSGQEDDNGSNYEDEESDPEISEEEPEEPPKAKKIKSSNAKKDPLGEEPTSSKNARGTKKTEAKSVDTTNRHLCDVPGCDKSYSKPEHVRRHQTRHHPEYKINKKPKPRKSRVHSQYCDLCTKSIPISEALKHIQDHVGDYALKCPYTPGCPFIASNPNHLKFHVPRSRKCLAVHATKNKELFGECDTCGFKTNFTPVLRSHLTNEHERSTGSDFPCPISDCPEIFGTRQSVWFHLESHSVIPQVKQRCELCKVRPPTGEMDEHLRSSHDIKEIIKCKQCPYVFSSRVSLLDHLYIHRLTGMTCDICDNGVIFKKHHDIRKHYVSLHNIDVKRHVCEHCGCMFRQQSSYVSHLKDRHPASGVIPPNVVERQERRMQRVKCDLCFNNVDFCNKEVLINHKILVHGAEPYSCKTCGEKFHTSKRYQRHVKDHLGIKYETEFKCDVEGCGLVYKQKHRLLEHKTRVHEGQKNHVCDICGKSMFDETTLKRHREAIHFGIRRFVCELCGKGFVERRKLEAHQKRMDHREYFANKS